MSDTQPTGVVVLMASDADALASVAELAVEEDLFPEDVLRDLRASARRARAALTKRLAVMGGQNDRLVEGLPVVVRLQDADR